ncbi:MAG: hypothetical protein HQL13_03070, partial [Candidatus Omnitrophica bacterium]|nr:hypothetical protein [Candidatus Omnitrophota bacterium]
LFQQVGGNVGYALVVTVIERQAQAHYAYLAGNISQLNKNFMVFYHKSQGLLLHQGVPAAGVHPRILAVSSGMVNRQALMMAYNDMSIVLLLMFIALLPLVLLFPVYKSSQEGVVLGEI